MAKEGGTRGVEHPIATDMALIGNTKNVLHEKPLSRKGPIIKAEPGKDDEVRNTGERGMGGDPDGGGNY